MYVEDCNFECHALEKKPRKHKKKRSSKLYSDFLLILYVHVPYPLVPQISD